MRLSVDVTASDVEEAMRLMEVALQRAAMDPLTGAVMVVMIMMILVILSCYLYLMIDLLLLAMLKKLYKLVQCFDVLAFFSLILI